MYSLVYSNQFKKDVKLSLKRGYNLEILKKIIIDLEISGTVSKKYKPHKLLGNYSGYWELHLKADWLLIYQIREDNKEILLARTGTHSDLFS